MRRKFFGTGALPHVLEIYPAPFLTTQLNAPGSPRMMLGRMWEEECVEKDENLPALIP